MSRQPCEGCAFTKGAAANREPHNAVRAQLCAGGAIPFYCHHTESGELIDLGEVSPAEKREHIQAGRMVICQGWRREVRALAEAGYFETAAKTKRELAEIGLGALVIMCRGEEDAEKKERLKETLANVILLLQASQGFTLPELPEEETVP